MFLDVHGEVFTTLDPNLMSEVPTPEELAAQIAILTALVNTKAGRDGTPEQSFSIGDQGSRIVMQSGKSGFTIYIDDQGLTEDSVIHLGDLFPLLNNSEILNQITQLPYIRVAEQTGPNYLDKVKEIKFPDGTLTINPVDGVVSVSFAHVHSAQQVAYTPSSPSVWLAPAPTQVRQALDQIAGRLYSVEGLTNRAYFFVFPNEADRLAGTGYTITAAHIGLWAKQSDNGTIWELTSHSPITWSLVIDPTVTVAQHVAEYPHPVASADAPADVVGRFWFDTDNNVLNLFGVDHNEPILKLDGYGNLVEVYDPRLLDLFCTASSGIAGTVSTITYHAHGGVNVITDTLVGSLTRTTTVNYDGNNEVTGTTIAIPALSYTKSETLGKNPDGQVTSITNT